MTNDTLPTSSIQPTDKAARALSRLEETFGIPVPEGLTRFAASETGIHDLYMNAKRQLDAGKVSKADKLLIATAIASLVGCPHSVKFFSEAAIASGASAQNVADSIAMSSICTIFNTYYHFKDIAPKEAYEGFKAPFNANTFMQSSLSLAQAELINIAVSSINNCHACVNGHLLKAEKAGVTAEMVDEAIKASAASRAFAQTVKAFG